MLRVTVQLLLATFIGYVNTQKTTCVPSKTEEGDQRQNDGRTLAAPQDRVQQRQQQRGDDHDAEQRPARGRALHDHIVRR